MVKKKIFEEEAIEDIGVDIPAPEVEPEPGPELTTSPRPAKAEYYEELFRGGK